MMDVLLQALDNIIKLAFKQDTQGGIFVLEEPYNNDYPVTLIKKRGKALAYQFDKKGFEIYPVFKNEVALVNKVCDYVIFYPYKQTLFVFLCELKTTNITGSSKQVQATEIFANFIVKMAQMYLNFKVFNVEYRALIFSTRTIKSITSKKTKEPYLEYPNGLKHKHLRAGEICQLDYHCY
ncbi:MAG: hypothetical protein DRR08_05385 [Candidatus Parabeggiatoa sp. nov. 2]|nr:MAG: hypothetical protein DRR08_05385 [Gammaproteobacteria bacterium]